MTTPLKYLNSQSKDSILNFKPIDPETEGRINKFLKAVPHLEFSATGIRNIAKRFGVPEEVINSLIEKASHNK